MRNAITTALGILCWACMFYLFAFAYAVLN